MIVAVHGNTITHSDAQWDTAQYKNIQVCSTLPSSNEDVQTILSICLLNFALFYDSARVLPRSLQVVSKVPGLIVTSMHQSDMYCGRDRCGRDSWRARRVAFKSDYDTIY